MEIRNERSFQEILQDIFKKLEQIVRDEIRLARTEVAAEAVRAARAGKLVGAGAVALFFGAWFLLLTCVYALAIVLPMWAASLVIGGGVAIIGGIVLMAGLGRFRRINAAPPQTTESIRENVQWTKEQLHQRLAK
ncbi:MAG TPA: phage holin family protein [Terriglobia bacterium]|nr:phage holin family protein [Terriglobia bacterium]